MTAGLRGVALPSVADVDTDRRAARFFADETLVSAELDGRTLPGAGDEVRLLHADYSSTLRLDTGFDPLVSLYSGPVWDHCREHLASGGLLATSSHGDACLAAVQRDARAGGRGAARR